MTAQRKLSKRFLLVFRNFKITRFHKSLFLSFLFFFPSCERERERERERETILISLFILFFLSSIWPINHGLTTNSKSYDPANLDNRVSENVQNIRQKLRHECERKLEVWVDHRRTNSCRSENQEIFSKEITLATAIHYCSDAIQQYIKEMRKGLQIF